MTSEPSSPLNLSKRYLRNHSSITNTEQARLSSLTVAIVGCGGLGGYMAELYARLGLGHLILIDGDIVEVTNLNRQLMSLESNLGELKVEAAYSRLKQINSAVKLSIYPQNLDSNNAQELLKSADLVCDALDNINDRKILEKACHDLDIPLVFAAIGGWYGLLGTSFPGDFSIERLYGQTNTGIEQMLGNPSFTPAVVASLAVSEGVKILLGKAVTLRKMALYIDLLSMDFTKLEL